jgi:hypothetical protein
VPSSESEMPWVRGKDVSNCQLLAWNGRCIDERRSSPSVLPTNVFPVLVSPGIALHAHVCVQEGW